MDPTTVAIIAAAAANAIAFVGAFAIYLGHRRRRAERLEERERERAQLYLAPVEARLAELGRALNVIALEVERVAEGQRYLVARDQSTVQRPPALSTPSPANARTVTPH